MNLSKTFLSAVLFTCLGILLMLFYYMLYNQLDYLNKSSDQVIHTTLVKLKLEQTFSAIRDAETGQRGYLLTRDSLFLSPYLNAKTGYAENISDLDSLTTDNPRQKNNITLLNRLVDERLVALNTALFIGDSQDIDRKVIHDEYMRTPY